MELSTRELKVLGLAVKGLTDEAIANELGIRTGTVNSYWVRIRGKLGHYSRTELVARYLQAASDEQIRVHEASAATAEAALDHQRELLNMANSEIERLRALLQEH